MAKKKNISRDQDPVGKNQKKSKPSLIQQVKDFYEEQPLRFSVTVILCAALAMLSGYALLSGSATSMTLW